MKLEFLLLLSGTLGTSLALAQQEPASGPASTGTNQPAELSTAVAKPADPVSQDPVASDPGVQEVLRMLKAGVSKDVIRVYIESSPKPYHLVGTDLIALKQASVPDELTTAMLKRGPELRLQVAERPPVPALSRAGRSGALDPESYDFWWYHYAYPRTLAYANERMLSPLAPFADSYYYPDLPFRPQPLHRFSFGP
jgi:hypothetical protein